MANISTDLSLIIQHQNLKVEPQEREKKERRFSFYSEAKFNREKKKNQKKEKERKWEQGNE